MGGKDGGGGAKSNGDALAGGAKADGGGGDGEQLSEWQMAYLAGEQPLQFSAQLPTEQEHTPRFQFQKEDALSTAKEGSGANAASLEKLLVQKEQLAGVAGVLVSWQASPGSRVGDSLFPSYPLPDGRTLRMFHRSHRRNAVAPPEEPAAPVYPPPPDDLTALQLDGLPAAPPPTQPSKRDVPTLPQSIHLGAPQPKEHVLKVSHDDVWYGTITTDNIAFGAKEKGREAVLASSMAPQVAARPQKPQELDLNTSVFASRKTTSDGRSFFSGPRITGRAFEIDWSRMNQERFRRLVAHEDDGGQFGADSELAEIKDVMFKHRELIYSTYSYYCAMGESHDGFVMGALEYNAWLRDCGIPDEESRACRAGDLDTIFITTNFEEKSSKHSEQSVINAANVDRALMRFEFLQCLVRVAIAKYIKGGHTRDVSEALETLLVEDMGKKTPPEARHMNDLFRRAQLYTVPINDVLHRNEASLRAVYEYYSAGDDEMATTLAGQSMSLQEWLAMLRDCGITDEHFTKKLATLCFVWSMPMTTDEIKRRQWLMNLRFVDFMEALTRIVTMKAMPSEAMLKEYHAHSAAQFFQQADAGTHAGREALKPLDWQTAEANHEHLSSALESLLHMIFERLDNNSDGLITRDELKLLKQSKLISSGGGSTASKKSEAKAAARRDRVSRKASVTSPKKSKD